jgi:WS/DGAT/MGAT family acyltransferase
MTTLSPLDSAFLRMDNRHTALHIASIAIFDGPPPTYDEIAVMFEDKIPSLPRYRQKVREAALWLGKPSWVFDEDFRLDDHLRHTALPRPGSSAQLHDLVGRVMSQPLDRSRPLWECWIVEGLADHRWAMINKVHHCMVDGIAGLDLLEAVLDHSPHPSHVDDDGRVPVAPSEDVSIAAKALESSRRRLLRTWDATGVVRHPRRAARTVFRQAHGLLSFAELARPATSTSLSGPIGSARCWGRAEMSLDDVRIIRSEWSATVNDVVLTAVTRGFRELLISRGEDPLAHSIRTLVPVSARSADQRGKFDNRVTAMIADLPIAEAYPVQRLRAVRHELDRLKRSGEPEAGVLITDAARWIPPLIMNAALTGIFRAPQRSVVTVATNVPGPRGRLYAAGRQLVELYPYVPIADQLRIGVAVTSYEGVLYFGVTADRDSSRDIAVLTAAIEQEVRELVQIARPALVPRRAKRGDVRPGSTGSKVRPGPSPLAPVRAAEGS